MPTLNQTTQSLRDTLDLEPSGVYITSFFVEYKTIFFLQDFGKESWSYGSRVGVPYLRDRGLVAWRVAITPTQKHTRTKS